MVTYNTIVAHRLLISRIIVLKKCNVISVISKWKFFQQQSEGLLHIFTREKYRNYNS